jgi:hypothetical protein
MFYQMTYNIEVYYLNEFFHFSDFKKMTGSLQRTHKKKFRMYTIYATINPLILSTSLIVLDNVLDHKSSLWPGIGENRCWFRSTLFQKVGL